MTSHASTRSRVAVRAPISIPVGLRRTVLVLGVGLSLILAVVTVRMAAGWAAASAPLAEPPAALSSIEGALAGERARSAALQSQLDSLRTSSDELAAALGAANDRLALDQTTADGLRTSLAAAQQKLATLEAAMKAAARAARAAGGGTTTQSTTQREVEAGDD